MIKVYGASTLKHADMWLSLRQDYKGESSFHQEQSKHIIWTATWPKVTIAFKQQSLVNSTAPAMAKCYWALDVKDITQSDVVMVYADEKDNLRGALVEAGVAIGQAKRVLLVGENAAFGTWQHHPLVSKVEDLIAAFWLLRLWDYAATGAIPWDESLGA